MRDIEVGLIIVGVYIPVAILVCLLVYAKSRGAFSTLAKKKQLLAQAMTRK